MLKLYRQLVAMVGNIDAIRQNTEKIMAAQDDLNNAVAALTTAVTSENSQIDTLVAELASQAKASGTPDSVVEGIVSQLNGLTSGINEKLAQFQQAVTPAPAPAPTPAPGS